MTGRTRSFATLMAVAIVAVASSAAAEVRFVDQDATGANDGTTWADAYTTIGSPLAVAVDGDEIWIKKGTYLFGATALPLVAPDPALAITASVSIYGGLDGNEATPAQRDAHDSWGRTWVGHAVVSSSGANSGNLDTDPYTQGVFSIAPGKTVLLDSVGISSGSARTTSSTTVHGWPTPNRQGAIAGGIHAGTTVTLTLTNCEISGLRNCVTAQAGGGGGIVMKIGGHLSMSNCVYVNNTGGPGMTNNFATGILLEGCAFDIDDCVFSNNNPGAAVGRAASICLKTMPPIDGPCTLTNTTFSNNGLAGQGIVALCWDTTNTLYTIDNCTFENNTSSCDAGAIQLGNKYQPGTGTTRGPGRVVVTDCEFTANTSLNSDGGCIRKHGNAPGGQPSLIRNCTFTGNSSRRGGAFSWKESDALVLESCKFLGNSATDRGAVAVLENGTDVVFTNCLFQENVHSTTSGNGGVIDNGGVLTAASPDAQVVNCTFVGNTTGAGGVIRQGAATSATLQVVNCLIADNTTAGVAPIYAATGTGRVATTLVDTAPVVGGAAAGSIALSNVDTTGTPGVLPSGKLMASSAAIDAGLDTDGTVAIPPTDIEGWGRIDIPAVGSTLTDMGAYEFFGGDISVNPWGCGMFGRFGRYYGPETTTITVTNLGTALTPLHFTPSIAPGWHSSEYSVSILSGGSILAPGEMAVLLVTWTPPPIVFHNERDIGQDR